MLFLQDIPPRLAKDLVRYTLPLLLLTSARRGAPDGRYWGTILGSLVASVPIASRHCNSKNRLVVSSVLCLVCLFVPSLYFFSLGFALNQSYNTDIFRSRPAAVNKLVSKIEIVGFLMSEAATVPPNIRLILGGIVLVSSMLARSPCIEAQEPFECMKARIDSAHVLNSEYRLFLKKEAGHCRGRGRLYIVDALYMLSTRKMDFLFSILFSFETSELFVFLIGPLLVFGIPWEFVCLLLRTEPAPNVTFRLASNYAVYLAADFISRKTRQ